MARDANGILSTKWANAGDTGEPVGFDRDEGWPLSYSQPGGQFPTREMFNLMFLELYTLGVDLNQNGAGLEYAATIDYVAKAIVRGSDGDYYIAASANGPATAVKNPVGDTTGVWENFYLNTSGNVATGTANAIILNAISGINSSAFPDGQSFLFKATATNTGVTTIQIGVLAAKSLTLGDGTAMVGGEIIINNYYKISYNKTDDRYEIALSHSPALNIQQIVLTSTVTRSNQAMGDLTGMAVIITPSKNTSKVLVMADLKLGSGVVNRAIRYKVQRGGADIYVGDAAGSRQQAAGAVGFSTDIDGMLQGNIIFLDSPASAGAVTYQIQWSSSGGDAAYLNRSGTDTDNITSARGASSITAIEIKI